MQAAGTINYLTSSAIDKAKWDRCIEQAPNGLIYSYSYYLDFMSEGWDALVFGDYEAVMPLTKRKKLGLEYLYQPAFTAGTGVTGKAVDARLVQQFIAAIPQKFRLIEILLNQGNLLTEDSLHTEQKQNYILRLNRDYESIYKNYKEHIRRNLKKAKQAGCTVKTGIAVDPIIELHRDQMQRATTMKDADYENFRKLYQFLDSEKRAITYGIFSKKNELIASCIYFFSHQRAYYILVGNHPDGRTIGASHFLIDRFIADNSGRDLVLDFEGSDLRNLAFFYSSFGSELEIYPALRINRLPWWIKWMKR